ncbi:MAG: hypothetical protein IT385_23800 [Deltaproteobacteria bacterium]|nr:hypothetical protein [Deltaproteobacteria bacterium]
MRPLLVALTLCLATPATAAPPAPVDPEKPLQTPNTRDEKAWMLQGWTANIVGIGGGGKTELVVEGEEGYVATIEIPGGDPASMTSASPARFVLADKDHRVPVKVTEPRGAAWQETVDVPKGMKITITIKARYEHTGYEGTIKNDTLGCKRKGDRKHYRFEVFQGETQIGAHIDLEPGKSAPGVRLKGGTYDLKIHARGPKGYDLVRTEKLEVKESLWRFDLACPH